MSIEAIEAKASTPVDARPENGSARAEASLTSQLASGTLDVADVLQRLEELEQEQRQIRWSSLLIAGLATIAVGLAVSTSLGQRFQPPSETQPVVNRRAISAQAFVLTDPQGHARARLTFE